ncbi:hypothetical protein C2I06_23725 [Niallia circulans]|nr:hypothetical protein C2I06_23725 [Niallia circulans]
MKKISNILLFLLLVGCQLFMLGYGYKTVDVDEYYHFVNLIQTDINYKIVLLMLILLIVVAILFVVYFSVTIFLLISNKVLSLELTFNFVYYLVAINLIITAFHVFLYEVFKGNSIFALYLNPLVLLSTVVILILTFFNTRKILASILFSILFYVVNLMITLIFY